MLTTTPNATGLPGQAASATSLPGGLVAQGVSAAGTDLSKRAKGLEPLGHSAAHGITHALVIGLRAVLAALEGADRGQVPQDDRR